MKKILSGLVLASLLIMPAIGLAYETPPASPEVDVMEMISSITNWLFAILLIMAAIFIIIAGFYFVTAMGDPAKILIAKKIILWTLIGLLVIMASKGLIALVQVIFKVEEPATMLQHCYAYVKNIVPLNYIL